MMKETFKPVGRITAVLYDENGNVKETRFRIKNKLTQGGRDWLCDHIGGGTGASEMAYISIGSGGSTAAASDDTALYGEEAREDATYSHTGSTASFELERTFEAGVGTGAIDEAGIFNKEDAAGGTMLARQVFSVINKGASDTLKITWTVDLGAIS
jgi:hypothetical protein